MAQSYFKPNKIFLGNQRDSYITTTEEGDIEIITETGGKTVIGDTGISHASSGGELAPVGGATGPNHSVHTGDAGGNEILDNLGTYTFTAEQQAPDPITFLGAPSGTYTFLKIVSNNYNNGANILLIPLPTDASVSNKVITFGDNSTYDLSAGLKIRYNSTDYNISGSYIDIGGGSNVAGHLITAGFNTDYIRITLTPNGANAGPTGVQTESWALHNALNSEGDLVNYWGVSPGRALSGDTLSFYTSDTRNTVFSSDVQIQQNLTITENLQAGKATITTGLDVGDINGTAADNITFALGNTGAFKINGNTDYYSPSNGIAKLGVVAGGEVQTLGEYSPNIQMDMTCTSGRLGAQPSFFSNSATGQDIPIIEFGANQPLDDSGRLLPQGTAIERVDLDGGTYGIWAASTPWYVVQETGTANGRTVGDWYIAGDTAAANMLARQGWRVNGNAISPFQRWADQFTSANPLDIYELKIRFTAALDYNENNQYFGGNIEIVGNIASNTQLDFYVDGSNEMRLESDGDLHVDGDVIATSTTISSDEKLKDNITKYENALDTINAIKGVSFDWKRNGKKSGGIIAQDVQKVLPELVKEVKDLDSDDTHLTVDYNAIIGVLVEAVKELSEQVNKK